ncbi:hypothetical protein MFLAVUS_010639 [Mucor flavus]|uniref:Uncharacterized protein n=1 Tax=Mucor flavus TaxID=439312 RepID=A0ABP9ZD95_9FUNG
MTNYGKNSVINDIHEERLLYSPNTPTPTFINDKRDREIDKVLNSSFSSSSSSSRPKRIRKDPVEQKLRRVQPLETFQNGQYKLPVRVGIITVHSLGNVLPIATYHNDRYIWPPGFKISRTYLSMTNPTTNTTYTCSIEENGEQGPKFRVIAEDCPQNPIIANSATGVWTTIVKSANEIRNRGHSNSASGPDYYGFTHATIAKMIQDLHNADQCENYVWQKFDVMHKRTAAGVAAAAQKKITNLEIMGSANKKPSKQDIHAALSNGYDSSFNKQEKFYKKSTLHQIMNTPDELKSQQDMWSSSYNYV